MAISGRSSMRRVLFASVLASVALALLSLSSLAMADGLAPGILKQELAEANTSNVLGKTTATSATESERIPNHYIVVLEDSVTHPGAVAEAQTESHDGELKLVYRHTIEGYSAVLSKDAVQALRQNPKVKYVSPDYRLEAFSQTIPTGIQRTFDTENEAADIDGEDTRVDVDVAVIDTGIDYTHPDLNVYKRTNCVPAGEEEEKEECVDNNGTDGNGHGTHVAGTIGALDNGEGVVGIAPGARLWAVRVLNNEGAGSLSWIVAGIDWVTAHSAEIEVANMSLGCSCFVDGPMEEAIKASVAAGVVYVVAAGNDASNALFTSPAHNPDVISVSALADYDGKTGAKATPLAQTEPRCEHGAVAKWEHYGADDELATFSNYGATIAAPGVCVLSTLPTGGSELGTGYGYLSGTSMASPHVAGAAALLASKANPNSKADVEAIRKQLVEGGSLAWSDNPVQRGFEPGPDPQEPLLYLGAKALSGTEVATGSALSISNPRKATLSGSINTRGLKTEYQFEYGTTSGYGQVVPASPKTIAAGGGYSSFAESLGGLKASTTYHYRLKATNSEGTFYGRDRSFVTRDELSTAAASGLTEHEATLNGVAFRESFNGLTPATSYEFDYGLTSAYGQHSSASSIEGEDPDDSPYLDPFGEGYDHVTGSLITGLNPGNTYHYRLVAKNNEGTFYGKDHTLRAAVWSQQTTPVEAPPGAGWEGTLEGLACTSVNDCMAVGHLNSPINNEEKSYFTLAEHWDGKSWTVLPTPASEGFRSYAWTESEELKDVSCATSSDCVAVGYATYGLCAWGAPCEANSTAIHWDGKKWSRVATPTDPNAIFSLLYGVSCTSATNCIAAGIEEDEEGGHFSLHYLVLRWDGTNWSEVEVPKAAYLIPQDVSCVAASDCFIVGTGGPHLALRWHNGEWSTQETHLHYGALGISCVSASDCMSVGGRQIGHWNGKEWTAADYDAAPAGLLELSDVVCAASWSCAAVGSVYHYTGFAWGTLSYPVAMHWDGKQWSQEAAPKPLIEPEEEEGVFGAELLGVSCASAANCSAVGSQWDYFFAPRLPLAERYEYSSAAPAATTDGVGDVKGTSATLHGTVNPKGPLTTYQFEYGLSETYGSTTAGGDVGSGSTDISVGEAISGLSAGKNYHYRIVATNGEGKAFGKDQTFSTCKSGEGCTWSTQTTLNPELRTEDTIDGVSCPTTSLCIAVGNNIYAGKGFNEVWNGTEWKLFNTELGEMKSLSCVSASWCMAVAKDGLSARTLKWSTNKGGELPATFSATSIPAGSTLATLSSVSCSSETACTAVGSYFLEGAYKVLVERWNGTSWSQQSAPAPSEGSAQKALQSVSCASSTSCVAVGTAAGKPFAESWNGTSWSILTAPNPSGAKEASLESVSCASSTSCMAAGSFAESAGGTRKPLAERWNGSEWSTVSVPNPSGTKGSVRLSGVSCLSASSCTAAGSYVSKVSEKGIVEEEKTLAETWNGSAWSVQSSPNPEGKTFSVLNAVSCASSTACTAVGNARPGSGANNTVTLGERYE
jgi:Subtilase family/Peptidase inhibitor I9